MFDTVIKYLEGLSSGEVSAFNTDERNLAIAALFYHMIAADGVVRALEKQQFKTILKQRLDLSEDTLEALIGKARSEDQAFSGLFPLTAIINQTCTDEQKTEIINQLMALARSDGELHPLELDLVENVAELLKLPRSDIPNAA